MMGLPKVTKSFTPHVVQYFKYLGVDDYDKPSFAEPVTVEHVRFDESLQSSSNLTEQTRQFNAVCFVYRDTSTPFLDDFVLRSKLIFNGSEYTIKDDIKTSHPFKDEVWSHELEVL